MANKIRRRYYRRALRRRRMILAVWAGAGCLLTSCGVSHPTLNAGRVSSEISSQLRSRYPAVTPTVSCPSGVRDTKGQTFVCTAVLDGQTLHLRATVTTGGGQFTVVPLEAVEDVPSRAAQLNEELRQQARTAARVDCGPRPVLIVPVQGTFTCTVTFTGQKPRRVTVTVLDVKGDFGYRVAASH